MASAAAASISSKFQLSTASPFESVAWQYVLPASLVLGIIASNTVPSKSEQKEHWSLSSLPISIPLMVSFAIGLLGSIIGGAATCKILQTVNFGSITGRLDALVCCLTASYIGGTMNFFVSQEILDICFSIPT